MTEAKSTQAATGNYHPVENDALIFDSHRYVKRMTGGGFSEEQAEALAVEQAELLNNLVTKQDAKSIRRDMATKQDAKGVKQDIKDIREDMATKQDVESVKQDIEGVKQDIEAVNTRLDNVEKNMATKQDIKDIRRDMATKKDLEVSIQQVKVEMIKWMTWFFFAGIGVFLTGAGALFAFLKLA